MTHFTKFLRFSLIFAAIFATASVRAQSFTYSPDTLTINPDGADSAVGYVRIAYNRDTTWPGTNIHCWISDGSTYFSCPTDTVHDSTYIYLRVEYYTASDTVRGQVTISDDTTTKTVMLIGLPNPPAPAIGMEGPYFPSIHEGSDTCTTMRLVNLTSSPDTIRGVSWAHNPNGIFTWDSVSLPYILGAHDTTFWTFCFHAPDNTTENIDSVLIYYGYNDAHVSRIVEGSATTNDGTLSAVGPYFPQGMREGTDTCVRMTLVNTSSGTDTIQRITWTHNPNGIFSWDSTTVPFTLGAHDTTYLTFCYHAPDNTETYTDSILVSYSDASGAQWFDTRVVSATAVVSDDALSGLGPYFPENIPEGTDTCVSMRLVNNSSSTDTIENVSWTSDNGIFTWDSTSVPFTLGSHDTTYLTFCWHAPDNATTYIDTVTVRYNDANGSGWNLVRLASATAEAPPPDAELELYSGPYFPDIVDEGHDTCATMKVINAGTDVDTIVSVSWSHNPNGIFTWDSVSLPATIGSHDTDVWTFCFHAPDDTNLYIDTFSVRYRDASYGGDGRVSTRVVEGKATDPSIVTCYTLYPSPNPAPVTNVGDTSRIHLYIKNGLSNSSTLTSLHFSGSDDGAFRIDTAGVLPATIPSDGYDSLWILFIPNRTTGEQEYTATLTATFSTSDTTHCREASVTVSGYMSQSCSDSETVDFDTSGVDNLTIYGDSGQYISHRIDLVNESDARLVIDALSWTDTNDHFLIVGTVPPSLPDTLGVGDTLGVLIHCYADTALLSDTLVVSIEHGITLGKHAVPLDATSGLFLIAIKATPMVNPAGVTVIALPSSLNLELYPNPASDEVTMQLDGATDASFQVIDMLGNIVAEHSGSASWQWDAASAGLANGTYFIRATNGSSVVTKSLVIQK